jgi:hypothetical protein
MRYKVKWRVGTAGPLMPELCESEDSAKDRVRELIKHYPEGLAVDVWNENETWQIVTPAGAAEWCKAPTEQ